MAGYSDPTHRLLDRIAAGIEALTQVVAELSEPRLAVATREQLDGPLIIRTPGPIPRGTRVENPELLGGRGVLFVPADEPGWLPSAPYRVGDRIDTPGGSAVIAGAGPELTPGGEVPLEGTPDQDLPGMWSRADFTGGPDDELCSCSRPDLADDPHRHPRDYTCNVWRTAEARYARRVAELEAENEELRGQAAANGGLRVRIDELQRDLRGWEEWSNDLASLFGEDEAVSNPEAAQEAIVLEVFARWARERAKGRTE